MLFSSRLSPSLLQSHRKSRTRPGVSAFTATSDTTASHIGPSPKQLGHRPEGLEKLVLPVAFGLGLHLVYVRCQASRYWISVRDPSSCSTFCCSGGEPFRSTTAASNSAMDAEPPSAFADWRVGQS